MRTDALVAITGANSATAQSLIPRLHDLNYQTTGLIRTPANIGTNTIIPDWTNAKEAITALKEADFIIHLTGDANAKNKDAYKASNYTTTRLVADAAASGICKRIIYLSYADASTHEKNNYLRYKGEAEGLLQATGKDIVIFRCPVIIDAPGQSSRMDALFVSQKGRPVPTFGDGQQLMRPLYRGDVVAAIIAALHTGPPGTYDLSGPEQFTIDEFIRMVNGPSNQKSSSAGRSAPDRPVRILHIPAWLARTLAQFLPAISPDFVDLMLNHTNSRFSPDAFSRFGITPTPVSSLFQSPL